MKLLAKIALVLGGAGSAIYAAPGSPMLQANEPAGAGSATANISVAVKLSPAEMTIQIKASWEQVLDDSRHIVHLQQLARKEKDIIKLNCVNDKVVQLKPLMNVVESSKLVVEGGSDDARSGAFDEGSKAANDIRHLREEADQCAGEPNLTSESANDWTHPPVPDNPFTNPFGDNNSGVEPPGYASPFS